MKLYEMVTASVGGIVQPARVVRQLRRWVNAGGGAEHRFQLP